MNAGNKQFLGGTACARIDDADAHDPLGDAQIRLRHPVIGTPFERTHGRLRRVTSGFRSIRAAVDEMGAAAKAEEDAVAGAG
jgi:hypothetical protein